MSKIRRFGFFSFSIHPLVTVAFSCIAVLSAAQQALAHHGSGGKMPANFWTGLLSGLAHPVIGLDHLAFVVAIGLLTVGQARGALILAGFVLAALGGTGIHLLNLDIPAVETAIAVSVIAFGTMLVIPNRLGWLTLTVLAAIAGLFHGYAYGEAIIGAQMTPLIAYLLGFTLTQYTLALVGQAIGNVVIQHHSNLSLRRWAGLIICGIGVVFFTNSFG